jgi:hypothetical protein
MDNENRPGNERVEKAEEDPVTKTQEEDVRA